MKLEDLLLKKEEHPILHESCFRIPIYPGLLDETININPDLAHEVFPKVANEWYDDLNEYAKTLPDGDNKNWIEEVFVKEKPIVRIEGGVYTFDGWTENTSLESNGFASALDISRNSGGTLYFDKGNYDCEQFVIFNSQTGYIRFSKEKAEAYAIRIKDGDKGAIMNIYAAHNIDYYPGALFLRNWAILYQNEALKELASKDLLSS